MNDEAQKYTMGVNGIWHRRQGWYTERTYWPPEGQGFQGILTLSLPYNQRIGSLLRIDSTLEVIHPDPPGGHVSFFASSPQPLIQMLSQYLVPDSIAKIIFHVKAVWYFRYLYHQFKRGELQVFHEDTDGAGNKRQLYSIPFRDGTDNQIRVVVVTCPTTGIQYLLRVPPTTVSCRQAVAWTFGILDPSEYQPIKET